MEPEDTQEHDPEEIVSVKQSCYLHINEIPTLLELLEKVVACTDTNRWVPSQDFPLHYHNCMQKDLPSVDQSRLQSTLYSKFFCSICTNTLTSVELDCHHRFCQSCFSQHLQRTAVGSSAIHCPTCNTRIEPVYFEQFPKFSVFLAKPRENWCKKCSERIANSLHGCYCEVCLGEQFRSGATGCEHCQKPLNIDPKLTELCAVCRIAVKSWFWTENECCPYRVCVLCQVESASHGCIKCGYQLTISNQAKLESITQHLVVFLRSDPNLFD